VHATPRHATPQNTASILGALLVLQSPSCLVEIGRCCGSDS
jgi:hypothetical protein